MDAKLSYTSKSPATPPTPINIPSPKVLSNVVKRDVTKRVIPSPPDHIFSPISPKQPSPECSYSMESINEDKEEEEEVYAMLKAQCEVVPILFTRLSLLLSTQQMEQVINEISDGSYTF